jgi:6-phosphogluconolactonase (cycloisomerase 2 family)
VNRTHLRMLEYFSVALLLSGLAACPAGGVAPAGRYAYVTDNAGNQVLEYSINATTGQLTALKPCPFIGTPNPTSAEVDPTGRFLYVVNQAPANTVSLFTIKPLTGCLVAAGVFPVGAGPFNLGITANSACLYVSNLTANTVEAYTIIPATGALGFVNAIGTAGPEGLAVDHFGQFVYVANFAANTVSGFTTNPGTCALLAPIGGTPLATGLGPLKLAVDTIGQFLLVTNNTANTVTSYTITPATGALVIANALPAGGGPFGVSVDHFYQYVYVADNTAAPPAISAFTINAKTGVLTAFAGVFFTAGPPVGLAVDQSGRFLYVADSAAGMVNGFTITPATGNLVATPLSPYPAGAFPVGVATTP